MSEQALNLLGLTDEEFYISWRKLTPDEKADIPPALQAECIERFLRTPSQIRKRFAIDEHETKPRLVSPRIHFSAVQKLWREGFQSGDKTGWDELDKHYTVMPGQFTVLTGWPGSGKSEFLDALLVNLTKKGWKFAMFSFENQPVEYHITKLMEKFSGMPFGPGRTERIPEYDLPELSDTIANGFHFTETISGAFNLDDCLQASEELFYDYPENKRGMVIDPWNELEHWRMPGITETEYVSHALSKVRNWARRNNVHVWIVAHPAKQKREEGKLPPPRPDMISGSVHWWNKADCCLCVERDLSNPKSPEVSIHVQKVRFKHIGRTGSIKMNYDRVTGRYTAQHVPVSIADYYNA